VRYEAHIGSAFRSHREEVKWGSVRASVSPKTLRLIRQAADASKKPSEARRTRGETSALCYDARLQA
jgi:hypothetical protein